MVHQMVVVLTDQEYQKLVTVATRNGTNPERLLHEMIECLPYSPEQSPALTEYELAEKL